MLSCEEAWVQMSQALDGLLSAQEQAELEEHLAHCPECSSDYQALVRMEEALGDLGETPAPPELSARVMARIRAEAGTRRKARRPIPLWRGGRRWQSLAGLAACALLCVGLYYGAGLGGTERDTVTELPEAVQTQPETSADLPESAPEEPEGDPAGADRPAPAQAPASEPEQEPVRSVPEEASPASPNSDVSTSGESGQAVSPAAEGTRDLPEPAEADAGEPETAPPEGGETPAPAVQSAPPEGLGAGSDQALAEEPEEAAAAGETAGDQEGAMVSAAAVPPWGSGTALVLEELPEQVQGLLPAQENWTQEEDGTRWCTVTAEELKAVQAALEAAGIDTALPELPWSEPCAVVLLPEETPQQDSENP